MIMLTNWQTSAAAIAPLFAAIGMILTAVGNGQMPNPHDLSIIAGFLSAAAGLLVAKDHNK